MWYLLRLDQSTGALHSGLEVYRKHSTTNKRLERGLYCLQVSKFGVKKPDAEWRIISDLAGKFQNSQTSHWSWAVATGGCGGGGGGGGGGVWHPPRQRACRQIY